VKIDVAITPAALGSLALAGASALVIDVLRASTSIITALANGCAGVVPVAEPDEAIRRAAAQPGSLVAGERKGDPLKGFHLGNSPLEFTRERVGGRTVFLTTTNGTGALLAVRSAAAIGVAAFVNAGAAASWALAAGRGLVIACAGDAGRRRYGPRGPTPCWGPRPRRWPARRVPTRRTWAAWPRTRRGPGSWAIRGGAPTWRRASPWTPSAWCPSTGRTLTGSSPRRDYNSNHA